MAVIVTIISIVMTIFVVIAIQETSSRLAWVFAHDNGTVLSQYLQQIHPKLDVPLYAIILTWALVFICGFIYLASETGECGPLFLLIERSRTGRASLYRR